MVRVAPDANDVLVYLLNDGPTTFVNTGTQGSSANWTLNGNAISGAQGPFGVGSTCLYVAGTPVINEIDGAGGANDVLITPNISLSGWVLVKRYSSSPLELFNKQYRLNGWSSPFLTFGFQMTNTNDGRCDLFVTLGSQGSGTLQSVNSGTNYLIQQGKWTHIGGTWDGTTLKFYVNGSLASSSGFSGTIDYNNPGSRGQWYCGGIPGTTVNQTGCALFSDIRVANIARPASYFANIYYNTLFVNG